MHNDTICKTIITNLENKAINLVNTTIALSSQGYAIDKSKQIILDWTNIMLHAFKNIDILSDEQKHKVELLYNKLSTI